MTLREMDDTSLRDMHPSYYLVSARINPAKSLYWMPSALAVQAAETLQIHPFLAIKLPAQLSHPFADRQEWLVSVSNSRPPGGSPFYVPIAPNVDGPQTAIRITPLLPLTENLYADTGRLFYMRKEPSDPPYIGKYSVELSDQELLVQCLKFGLRSFGFWQLEERRKNGRSGGPEPIGSKWDTFSGREQIETLHNPNDWDIEISDIEESDISSLLSGPYHDFKKIERIIGDYSWSGASATIKSVQMCNTTHSIPVSEFGCLLTRGHNETEAEGNVVGRPHALHLHALTVPIDGEGPATIVIKPEDVPRSDDWDDYEDDEDWEPDLPIAPEDFKYTVRSSDIRVICFDVYGTLINRERGLSELLLHASKDGSTVATDLLELYLEQEINIIREEPGQLYSHTVQVALQSMIHHDKTISNSAYSANIYGWKLYDEARDALEQLRAHGYRLVAIPNVDRDTFSSTPMDVSVHFDAIIDTLSAEGLCMQKDDIYINMVRVCSDTFRASPEQILVVSSGGYRCIEPCALIGVATAWVRREGSLEGREELASLVIPKPTFTVRDLQELCRVIDA